MVNIKTLVNKQTESINWVKMEPEDISKEDSFEKEIKTGDSNMRGKSDIMVPNYPLFHTFLKLVTFVVTCFLLIYFTYLLKDYIHAVLLWTEHQPPWSVLFIFIALFTLVSLPFTWGYIVVNLACGYLFGVLHGLLVTVFTATAGISITHAINKMFLASHLKKILNNSDLTKSLVVFMSGSQAFKLVVLARFTPIPFGLQNAVFSISSLSTSRYIAASVLGLLPTQSLNVYIGSTLRSMEEVLTNEDTVRTGWILLAAQLVVSVLVAVFVVRKARLELDKALIQGENSDKSDQRIEGVIIEK